MVALTGGQPGSKAELAIIEKQIGHSLPADYRAFLSAQGGGEPKPNGFSHNPRWPPTHTIARFFTVKELVGELARAKERAALGYLPIAVCDEGTLFLCLVGGKRDYVYVPLSDAPENLFWLSDGFKSFINSLKSIGEEAAPAPPSRPKRLAPWTAPRRKLNSAPPVTEAGYRSLVIAQLHDLLPTLVADLRRRVFRLPFPAGTASLDFEIHHRELDNPVPIVGYLMDGNRGQVQTRKRGRRVLAPNVTILPAHKSVVPSRMLSPFRRALTDMEHGELLLRWFVAGWKAADGAKHFALPASISFHDDDNAIVLPSAKR